MKYTLNYKFPTKVTINEIINIVLRCETVVLNICCKEYKVSIVRYSCLYFFQAKVSVHVFVAYVPAIPYAMIGIIDVI